MTMIAASMNHSGVHLANKHCHVQWLAQQHTRPFLSLLRGSTARLTVTIMAQVLRVQNQNKNSINDEQACALRRWWTS